MTKARVLRLSDMIFLQKGSAARRLVHAVFSIALRLFFRRIETSREELVPMEGAVIFVINHPNGLIDPSLIFSSLPRRISFLAKSTLFRIPVISYLLRTVEALPLYRRVDAGEDMSQNIKTFEACRRLLRQGRCIALFPEGLSHSSTKLMPIKTGAARIALGAISLAEDEGAEFDLKIVPVGLYYTSKTSFRSEALIRFGQSMTVEPVALDETGEPPREPVRELSRRIEAALREVTLNVESDEALEDVSKTEQLFSSIYEGINIRQSLSEEFDLRRRFASGLRARESGAAKELRGRILSYEEDLATLGITHENLSLISHSGWYVFRHFLLRSMLLLMLLPLAFIGAVLHFPAYFFSNAVAQAYREHGVDDIISTVKILAAIVLMPLTWLAVTFFVFIFWGWRISLLTLPSVIVCGYVSMRFVEEAVDMTGWYKAVLALVRRRHTFLRLLLERRRLHNAIRRIGV